MHKTCKNCGATNSEHALFCAKCGSSLHAHAEEGRNGRKGFTIDETIIAIGAIAMFVSFFLPWVSALGQTYNGITAGSNAWYVYLLPISAVLSCVLLFFSRGATTQNKILTSGLQIMIGTIWAALSLTVVIVANYVIAEAANAMGGLMGGSANLGVGVGIGMYLLACGAVAILVGAFKLQRRLSQ